MPTHASVDAYQSSLGEPARSVLAEVREWVAAIAPGIEEVISYDMPTFALGGRRLFHVAAWKQHLAVYPVPEATPDDPGLAEDLAPHVSGASTLKLPYRAGIPWPLLERVVRAHVARAEDG